MIIGADNLNFITKLDSESVSLGTSITSEFYTFIIYDTNKINCNTLKGSLDGNKKLIDFDEEYINKKEFYCKKVFTDKINTKIVLIQDDILILKIYTD